MKLCAWCNNKIEKDRHPSAVKCWRCARCINMRQIFLIGLERGKELGYEEGFEDAKKQLLKIYPEVKL